MDYLPIFLDLKGRPCLVVGGGAVAHRKILLLLKAGAEVSVVATKLCASLTALTTIKYIPGPGIKAEQP